MYRYVTEADLTFFQERIEEEADLPGVGEWQHMTDMKLDNLTYTAWRRRLPVSLPSFTDQIGFVIHWCKMHARQAQKAQMDIDSTRQLSFNHDRPMCSQLTAFAAERETLLQYLPA